MPRVKRSLAVIYAANPFGADHQSHEHDPAIEEELQAYMAHRKEELKGVEPIIEPTR